MKRLLLALAGYALYRWWTKPPASQPDEAPPIALPPPRRDTQQAGNPSRSKTSRSKAA